MKLRTMIFQPVLLLAAAIWLVSDPQIAAAQAGLQKRVLLLYDTRSDMLGNIVVDRTIRAALYKEFDVSLDVYSEYFEVSARPEKDYEALLNWLCSKYEETTFNVVVAVGPDALRFVSMHERDLFAGARIVFWGRKEGITNWKSKSPLTGVLAPELGRSFKATVEFIRALQPDLQRLIVVSGASPADRRWEAAARSELRAYKDRFTVSYLTAPTLESLEHRLAQLPRRTAIAFLTMIEDGAGRRLSKAEFLPKVLQAASAPVYITSAAYLDKGIVGGAVVSQDELARDTARVVTRLLRGERVQDIPMHEGQITPVVNWRELRRWNIPEDRVPQGSVVVERDPSIWEMYKWRIIGVLGLCGVEAILIVALLIHRRSRLRAEKSVSESKRLLQSTIDALNAHIALLDGSGKVVAVNQAWLRFGGVNGFIGADKGVGQNYLEVCESGMQGLEARRVLSAIREMISGEREEFGCVYECAQFGQRSWFQVRMNRFYTDATAWVVLEHENVTEIKRAHDVQQQLTGLLLRAQDDERRRIARDLHDVTVQNLASIKADLMRVRRSFQNLDVKVLEKIDACLMLSDQVIKELRTLSYLLHPPLLDELGLIPALQWFVRGFIERSRIQVELRVEGDIGRLTPDIETALFRVAQESLTNIHRHSGSPSAVICVTRDHDSVILQIADEGRGIAQKSPARNQIAPLPGVGIMGMGERLRQLGGRLEIESGDRGTTVRARVPIIKESYAAYSNR